MTQWAWLFLCALTRLMPLALLWPGTAGRVVPLRIRVALALALTLWIASLFADTAGRLPIRSPELGIVLGYELLLGLGLALGLQVLLVGVQLAGSLVSQLAGLSFSDLGDPGVAWGATAMDRFLAWSDAGRPVRDAGAPPRDCRAADLFSGGAAGHSPSGRRCGASVGRPADAEFSNGVPPGGSDRLCLVAGDVGHGAAGTLDPST